MAAAADPPPELEWVELLPEFELAARWHVREGGVSRVAWAMHETPYLDNVAITEAAQAWCGFRHPRASEIRYVGRHAGKLIVLVDDDRGPSVAAAAAHLAQLDGARAVEHEGWLVAQFVTLADALGAMGMRRPGFVYRGLDSSRLFVDHTGRGRLRAPVAVVLRERGPQTTGAGISIGSPHYLSPEQCLGNPVTPASDVFALASLFVEAVSGTPPFDGDSLMTVLQKILTAPPVIPALHSAGLAAVLERAFAREPKKRISDPAALAAELYACVPDAGDYDAVVSDRLAAWWPTAPQAHGPLPADRTALCAKTWDALEPTTRPDIRFCGECEQAVVQIRSLAAAIPLAGNTCINFQPR